MTAPYVNPFRATNPFRSSAPAVNPFRDQTAAAVFGDNSFANKPVAPIAESLPNIAADASAVAPQAPAVSPAASIIGALQPQNVNQPDLAFQGQQPGVEYQHGDMRDILTAQGTPFDALPGLGEARGLTQAAQLGAEGHPILAATVAGASLLPMGGKFVKALAERGAAKLLPKAGELAASALNPLANEAGHIGAWHGSPHKFDRFSMDKIGTGEGAQAYGHGLYFTDKKEIAEHYRNALSQADRSPWHDIAQHYIKQAGGDRQKAVQMFRDYVSPKRPDGKSWSTLSDDEITGVEKAILERPGATYKVDLNVEPDDLLDWDKPLAQQTPRVQEALKDYRLPDVATGQQVYDALKNRKMSATAPAERRGLETYAADASAELRDRGIKGIRYLDGNSRKAGEGAHNYVIFDDKAVNIAERGRGSIPMLTGISGAGVGGAVGYQKDKENPFRGAAIGALAGGLLGAGAGKLVENLPGLNERGGITVPPARAEMDQAIAGLIHPKTRKPFAGAVDPEQFVNKAKFALDPSGEERLLGEVDRVVREQNIAPKTKVTWDQTREIAKSMGLDQFNGKVGRLDGPRMLAIRNIVSQNVDALGGLYKKLNDGGLDVAARGELDGQIAILEKQNDALLGRFVKARTQTGRDLNNLKILANRVMDPVTWLSKAENLMQQGGRTLAPEQRRAITDLVNSGDKGKLVQYIAGLRPATAGEKLTTLWKAGLLTAPPTHLANLAGNVGMLGLETAKDAPAAIVDRLLSLATGQRTKSFSVARTARASWKGAIQGVKEAKLALQGVPLDDALAKYDLPKTTSMGNPILDAYTHGVFRSLEAEDRVFRSMALQRSLAEQLALNGGTMTDEIALQAVHDAEVATFQDKGLLSEIAAGARAKLKGHPVASGIASVVAPFTKTPSNVVTRVAEYSPLGFLKSGADVVKLLRGLHTLPEAELRQIQRAASETAGRAATGTTPVLAGYFLAKHGLMTGARPSSTSERETWNLEGKQENAIKWGGKWHSVTRISPIGNLMALGANTYFLKQKPDLTPLQVGAAAAGSIGTTLTEQSFLSGVQSVGDALKDPIGEGGKWLGNTAASVVPAIVRRTANAVDPTVREVKTVPDAFQARIPGKSKELPAKIDQLGHEAKRQGGWAEIFDPFSSRKDQTLSNPVIKELQSVGANIGPIKQRKGEGRQSFHQRQILYGRAIEGEIKALMADPEYPQLSREGKQAAIEDRIQQVRAELTRELTPR